MSEKVSLMLKVCPNIKALLAECARVDRRTMAGYVESLVVDDAKAKKITVDDLVVKAKKVAPPPVDDEQELPDYLDKEVWADWCAHRASIKKPLSASSIKYSIREMGKAHSNGWDVNALIIDAMAKQWTGFVFDKHRDGRADGKEIVVDKVSKEEIEEHVNALLKMDCLYVASVDVWRKLFETALENSQLISASDVANICKVLRKVNGNKYTVESDDRLNAAIQSKSVLDDYGNLTLFTREELTKSGL